VVSLCDIAYFPLRRSYLPITQVGTCAHSLPPPFTSSHSSFPSFQCVSPRAYSYQHSRALARITFVEPAPSDNGTGRYGAARCNPTQIMYLLHIEHFHRCDYGTDACLGAGRCARASTSGRKMGLKRETDHCAGLR
jgi:hypothetical protein